MSLVDLLYPWNPTRREDLIRKSQQIQDLMEGNFRATNQLTNVLNKYLGLSFSHISLEKEALVKENCDVLINRIHEIQAEVEKIDQKLKEKLEPELYEKLRDKSLSKHKQSLIPILVEIGLNAAAITFKVISWLIKNKNLLTGIRLSLCLVSQSVWAGIKFSVLLLAFDVIFEAIVGAIERDQLEKALKEYDQALNEFKPASEEYQDKITSVKARLEIMMEDEENE